MAKVVILLALLMALSFAPQMWVQRVIRRHSGERADFPGNGGEFARHLLDRMGLNTVKVEESTIGDHYDPEARVVRLLPAHFNGRSLSAVVIAAHEVGHAMQDASGYRPLAARTRLAKQALRIQQVGAVLMLVSPLMVLVAKSPYIMLIQVLVGLIILSLGVLLHAVTLPVEFDASFRRALPVLEGGNFIKADDVRSARQILWAAALTYVAAAAMSVVDVMRWLRVLRI